MTLTALIVLTLVFLACLWGGLVLGPDRFLPFLLFTATLLLPANVVLNIPALPDLDRHTAVTLPGLLLLAITRRSRWAAYRTAWPDAFLFAFVAWGVFCVLLLQGTWAAMSRLMVMMVSLVVPYVAGRLFLSSNEDLRVFVRATIPLFLVYFLLILAESRLGAVFRPAVYGIWTVTDSRMGLFRPTVFASDTLELGNHMGLAAILFLGAYRGWKGLREPIPRFLLVACAACAMGCLLSLSRGPIVGLGLALVAPIVLRNTRWLGVVLGFAGLAMFLWMLSPGGSGGAAAAYLGAGNDDIGSTSQTLNYRFLQIDHFKPMVWSTPWVGFGENWRRPTPINVIDGILLLHTLAYGIPGAILAVMFWMAVTWYVGRAAFAGNTPYAYIGAYLAPVIGWLTFSSWGDSFLRQPHLVLMSAVVGAMYTERKLAKPLLPPLQSMMFKRG